MTKLLNIDETCHIMHDKQLLCALADRKQMLTLARLSRDGKFFCMLCGRVAAEAQYVCAPTELSCIE